MYIIELFFKIKEDLKRKKIKKNQNIEQDIETCEHLFVPIDSTKRVLACSKCGMVYTLKEGETNPFC